MYNFNIPYFEGFMDASDDDGLKYINNNFNDDDEQHYFEEEIEDSNPMNVFNSNNTDSNDFPTYGFDDEFNNVAFRLYRDEICNNDTDDMNENFSGNRHTEHEKYPLNFKGQTTNNGFSSQLQRQKRKRTSPDLNPNAQRFKQNYYKLITKGKHKVVRKELIVRYHKMIYNLNIGVRPLLRDPTRVVNVYFNTYADQEFLILNALSQLISQGVIDYENDYRILASQKE